MARLGGTDGGGTDGGGTGGGGTGEPNAASARAVSLTGGFLVSEYERVRGLVSTTPGSYSGRIPFGFGWNWLGDQRHAAFVLAQAEALAAAWRRFDQARRAADRARY